MELPNVRIVPRDNLYQKWLVRHLFWWLKIYQLCRSLLEQILLWMLYLHIVFFVLFWVLFSKYLYISQSPLEIQWWQQVSERLDTIVGRSLPLNRLIKVIIWVSILYHHVYISLKKAKIYFLLISLLIAVWQFPRRYSL